MLRRFLHVLESVIMFSIIMFTINYFRHDDNNYAAHEQAAPTSQSKPDFTSHKIDQTKNKHDPNYVPDKIVNHQEAYLGENDQHVYNHRDISVYDGTREDALHKAVSTAIDNWNQNGTVLFYLTDHKDADIRLSDQKLNPRIEGITQQWVNDKTHYVAYSVCNFDYQWLLKYSPQPENMAKVVEHEFGHAMGLDHVKKYSIMRTGSNDYGLTQNDFSRIKTLYQNKPLWKDGEQVK